MASVPRVLAARVLCLAVRSRVAAVRPSGAATLSSWRSLSAASYPAWKRQEWACESRPSSLTSRRWPAVSRWSSTAAMTVAELEEKTVAVLKMFDKVKPEKVSTPRPN